MHIDLKSIVGTVVHRKGRTKLLSALVAVALLALSSYTFTSAQSTGLVTQDLAGGTLTAQDLANELDASDGGVVISNVVYTGTLTAAGKFSGGKDIIGFDSGIILSTGNVADVVGPNDRTIDVRGNGPGDAQLTALAGQPTKDAAVLTFDFVPNGDKVYFNFVFSSEEYNDYVGQYNDVFAFYVNGENCALVGGKPVSINTINKGTTGTETGEKASNPELYRNNMPFNDPNGINTQMNGLTTVLTCEAAVNAGETNTMKLAIADAGDDALCSNVFIEAGSLSTIPPTPTPTTEAAPTPTPTPTKATVGRTNTTGDVHIHTPDGLIYDFQEVGDFLLTQSTTGDVVLQARQASWENNPQVSVNKAVAMNVAGDVLEFYLEPERSFYINDVLTDLPTGSVDLPQGGSITLTGLGATDFTIYWPDGNTGARVVLHGSYLDIGIARLNGSLTYEGVLGDLDGNSQNDLQIRDGNQIQPPPNLAQLRTFGDSWRVPAEDSLFRNAEEPAEEADPAVQPLGLGDIDAEIREQAEAICRAAGVTDSVALRNCVYDVAATGDEAFVESARVFEEGVKDLPSSARVPVQPGETLAGNIFDADQSARSGISILDGDDLLITTGKLADGTGYIRFNIYRDGMYVASYSVSTDAAVADGLAGATFATLEMPEEESGAAIPEEDLALLQEAIPFCAEGMFLLAENMYEYPGAADAYAGAYQVFVQEYLPGCEVVSGFASTYEEEVGIFFDEVGFSFEDFVASDGYSKATWSDTVGTITNIGTRLPQYCPNAHLSQYDCVKTPERSLLSIDAALLALDLLHEFSEQ